MYRVDVPAVAEHAEFLSSYFGNGNGRGIRRWAAVLATRLRARTVEIADLPARPDVLVLHATAKTRELKRVFFETLTSRGLKVAEEVFPGWRAILRQRLLAPVPESLPGQLLVKASYARYLAQTYRPRMLITFMESDVLSAFLRQEVNHVGGIMLNCAHSITFNDNTFTMADFDYYFLYGKRSLENLKANPRRYGATRAVLVGSLNLGGMQELAPITPNRSVLYFSSWIKNEFRQRFLEQFAEVIAFATTHPDWTVTIRPHPLEDHTQWDEAARRLPNLRVSGDEPLAQALRDISITLSASGSATALDAALLNRVPLIVDSGHFGLDHYREYPDLNRRPGEGLGAALERVHTNYALYRASSRKFVADNLERGFDAPGYAANCIMAILDGKPDFAYFELPSAYGAH